MVFGLDFSGALLQLVEGRRQGQIACDIGLSDEGASQTMAESGDLLHEVATMFANVCQLDRLRCFGLVGHIGGAATFKQ